MSLLATISPLIGSWADQAPDERQLKLMGQQIQASVARRQAAGESIESIHAEHRMLLEQHERRLKEAQQTLAMEQQQREAREAAAAPPTPPAEPAAPTEVYHQYYIDPFKPMRASFQVPPPAVNGGPAGGWGLNGKLKEMARDVFERAYGLNGKAQEDHETMCEEIMIATGCSRKSFCELIYGHSYAADLTDLRAMVPNYRTFALRTQRMDGVELLLTRNLSAAS
jgi:hypothetical protein